MESSCPSRRIPDGSIQLLIEAPEFQPRAGDLEDIVAELMVNVVIPHSFLGLTEAGIRRETLGLNSFHNTILSLIKPHRCNLACNSTRENGESSPL